MQRKHKILIVEDSNDARELFALVLNKSGFDVIEAADGYEAIKSTRTNLPDLILMDLMMPKLSGDEATNQIKADPATKHIPIIVLTAAAEGPAVQRAMAAGAAKIWHKPITLKSLADDVHEYLLCENVSSSVITKDMCLNKLPTGHTREALPD
jgi:CheY-like chemotaxis protein